MGFNAVIRRTASGVCNRWAAGAAVALLVAGCGGGSSSSSSSASSGDGGTQTITKTSTAGSAAGGVDSFSWSVYDEPPTLDWVKGSNTYPPATVLSNICESLLRQNPDYSVTPSLAKSFSHPNPKTWIYQIREGVKFHSGATLTPADVVFSLKRAADASAGSVVAGAFANVKSITTTGAHGVKVELKHADALFNVSMSMSSGIIENAAYVKSKGSSYGSPQGGVDCTGPYSLENWQKGAQIDLQAFPGYWDSELKPKAQQVTLKFLQDPAARATALKTGTVDGAYYISPSGTESLKNASSGKLSYGANPTVRSLMVFHLDNGPLKDVRLRKAISLALDRPAVIKAAFGGVGSPAAAPVARDAFAYEKSTFEQGLAALPPVDKPNIAEAKKLVSEAPKPSRPIVVASSNSDPSYDLTALAIQSAGQQIGLDIKIRRLPIQQYNALFADESQRTGIDLFQTTWNLDYADPLEFYGLFAREGVYNNFVDYDNPKYTALADRAIQADSPAERAKLTVQLQSMFMDDMPWIPMFEIPTTVFLNKRLGGAPTSSAYLAYPWAATIGAAG